MKHDDGGRRAGEGSWVGRGVFRDPGVRLGMGLLTLVALLALVGPWLTADPNLSDFAVERATSGAPPGPSATHPLGTDPLFRDVLARLCHGARTSLLVSLAATAIALSLGTAIGMASALARGAGRTRIDAGVERVVDVAMAFPYLLLVTAIGVAVERADVGTMVAVLGLTSWPGLARAVRAKTLVVQSSTYVMAARGLGATPSRLLWRHLLPAVAPLLLVVGSHAAGQMVMAEAVLSYLTVGITPPDATWGRMLHEAESHLGVAPRLLAAPGVCILITVLGFTRLGEGLRRRLGAGAAPTTAYRPWLDLSLVAAVVVSSATATPQPLAPPVEAAVDAPGGTVRLAFGVPIRSLDPALAYDEAAKIVDDHLFATLVTWNHEGRLVGDLARSFEVEDEGRVFRFRLREGARFHDGAPVTAGDVKRSLERTLHPKTPSPGAALYAGLEGLDAYQKNPEVGIAGLRVVSPLELTVSLDAPDAGFLARLGLAFAAPVCPSVPSPVDPKAPVEPCGAGPFQWVPADGDRVVLERVAPSGRPGEIRRIEWSLEVPPRTQRYRFERGELDLLTELTAVDAARYVSTPAWDGRRFHTTRPTMSYVFLNTSRPPFDNRDLRRAVSLALDPSGLEKVRPSVTPADRMLPPGFPGPALEGPGRRHDLTAALEAMRAAGYPFDPTTGAGGYPKPIVYVTVPDTFEQAAAEIFQQQLASVGLRIELRLMSWAAYLALLGSPDEPPMGWFGWGADYPDPSTFFDPLLRSDAITDSGTQNAAFFRHPPLDALLTAARRETDVTARMTLYARAEEIVVAEAPLVPVYAAQVIHLAQPRLLNYRPHPVVGVRLHDVALEETP